MQASRLRRVPVASLLMVLVVLVVLAAHRLSRAPEPPRGEVFTGPTMGTTYSIKLDRRARDLNQRQSLSRTITETLVGVDARMSTYRADSELARIGATATTEPIAISAPLFEVIAAALEISAASDGAFDVTVAPLVDLWGFGPPGRRGDRPPPTRETIATARERTGWKQLELDAARRTLRKARPDLAIDLSAIAKGYAVDRVVSALEEQGVEGYLVEIGGEVRARGRNPSGQPWMIGIERPGGNRRALQTAVPLDGRALATSGTYRNYYEASRRRVSHAIDPSTGEPVAHRLASVSVIADTCMMADAWATALLVLGPEKGFALAESRQLDALFLVEEEPGRVVQRGTNRLAALDVPTPPRTSGFMMTLLATLAVLAVAMGAMAIGVLVGRKPLRGSCGGAGSCEACDGCSRRAARRGARIAPSASSPTTRSSACGPRSDGRRDAALSGRTTG